MQEPVPRAPDSVGVALDPELAFLTQAQLMHLLLMQGPHFEGHWAVLRGIEEGFLEEVMSKKD